jgi:hypothetical protein
MFLFGLCSQNSLWISYLSINAACSSHLILFLFYYINIWRKLRTRITKITVFVLWDVELCSLLDIYRHFRDTYCLHHPDDVGSKQFWNISPCIPHYTTQHPRRHIYLYSSPWEPEFLPMKISLYSFLQALPSSLLDLCSLHITLF